MAGAEGEGVGPQRAWRWRVAEGCDLMGSLEEACGCRGKVDGSRESRQRPQRQRAPGALLSSHSSLWVFAKIKGKLL